MRISLGRAMAAAGLAVALAACGSPGGDDEGGDAEMRELTLGYIPSSVYTPVELGVENGYFEEKGLKIDLVTVQGAGPAVTAVESGSIDGFANTPVVLASANEAGSDLRAFCAGTTQTVVFLAAKGGEIPVATQDDWEESVRTWKGKTVGIPALGGNAEFITKDLIAEAGLKADDVELVAVGMPNEAAIEQLNRGVIDVLYSWPYFTESLRDATDVALPLTMTGPEGLVSQTGAVWTASEAWLDENSELATDFCSAYGDLIDQTLDEGSADEVEQLLVSKNSVPADSAGGVLDAALEDGGGLSIMSKEVTCEDLRSTLALSVDNGELKPATVEDCDTLVWSAP